MPNQKKAGIEDLIEELKKCNTGDEEVDHLNADAILLKIINDERVTKVWNEIRDNFWYA